MLKLPVEVFIYGMEMLVKTMQGMQKLADQGVDTMLGHDAPSQGGEPYIQHDRIGGAVIVLNDGAIQHGAEIINHTVHKEESNMSDVDLRGDDLKLVRYAVVFTRYDLEVSFDEKTELLTYATSLDEYKGAKKSDFLLDLEKNPRPIPEKWKSNGATYPPAECRDGDKFKCLPQADRDEFLKVAVQLIDRFEKGEDDNERDQTKALKGLASTVKDGAIQVKQT